MLILIILVILLSLFFFAYWRVIYFRFVLPPGPLPWPFVGNAFQLDTVRPYETIQTWSKIYGPVFTIWLANEPVVIITEMEPMKQAMLKQTGSQPDSRPFSFATNYLTGGNFGITFANGDLWKEQRKYGLHAFRTLGLGRPQMEHLVLRETKKLIAAIKDEMDHDGKAVIDFREGIELCIFNILCSVGYGRVFDKNDRNFHIMEKTLDDYSRFLGGRCIIFLNSFPWLRHIPLFGHFGMDKMKEIGDNLAIFFNEEIDKKINDFKKDAIDYEEPTNLADLYLCELYRRGRDDEDMSQFSEQQLGNMVGDMIIAGMEASVVVARWSILAMMLYPEVQQKVLDEIDSTLGREKTPSMNDRQSMPYVMATISEALRWSNLLPLNFLRTSDTDTKIGAFTIPRGVCMMPLLSTLVINEKEFPEPQVFRPERFLEEDGKTLNKKADQYAPFSLGKRKCMGEGLAKVEMFLIFVSLMQKFKFAVVPGEKEPSTEPVRRFTSAPQPHKCLVMMR